VFENEVLRKIFGRKKEEVTGGSGKLQNEVLQRASQPKIIRMNK
jgi:hypothetical protein